MLGYNTVNGKKILYCKKDVIFSWVLFMQKIIPNRAEEIFFQYKISVGIERLQIYVYGVWWKSKSKKLKKIKYIPAMF